jgi:hypothetical protein
MRFNSTVYRVDLGLQVLPQHIIYGEAYLDYLSEAFDLSRLGTVSAPDIGGQLIRNVTRLTTLTFCGIRTLETSNPAIVVTGVGDLSSVASVNIDHELRHNLMLDAFAGYENNEYQGISRIDNVFTGAIGGKHLPSRNLYVGASYSYQQPATSGGTPGLPHARSIVMLRVSTRFSAQVSADREAQLFWHGPVGGKIDRLVGFDVVGQTPPAGLVLRPRHNARR